MNTRMLPRTVALAGVVTVAAVALGGVASTGPASATPAPAPAAAVAAPAAAQAARGVWPGKEEYNKRTAIAFVDLLMNKKKPQLAADRYLGSTYIQHNPQIANGKQALVAWATGFEAAFPQLKVEVKRAAADGDLVMVHSHLTLFPGDRGTAVMDIVRLDKGKIVEHWDVLQAVPETSANTNTMF